MKNFVLIMFATIALATLANAQSVGCSTKEQCTIYPYTECMEGWCKSPEEPLKPTSLKIIEQETPCTSDSQCGIISCINGVCGGPCQEGGPHPCPGPMPGVHIRKPRLTLPRITTEMFEEHTAPNQGARRTPKIADSLPGPVPVPQRPRCPVQCQDTAVAEPTICAPERPCPPHSGGRPPIKAATTHSLGGPLPDPTKLNPWPGAIAAAITPPRCPLSGPCKPPVL